MTQPKALYLADVLEDAGKPADIAESAAAELRRLHAELERCRQVCAATAAIALAHRVKMYETALEEIAWSNNSTWQQYRAKHVLAKMRGVEL